MAEELSIDDLKDMKKADFIAAFKKKAAWRKAKAVIVFVAFKLDGKKNHRCRALQKRVRNEN